MEINNVYQGNCKDLLKKIPNNFIDLTVTSPPYDDLRDYDGCDWNMDIFKEVAKELYRVTKDGGVVVWVVGDSTVDGSETGNSFREALFFMDCGFNLHDTMIYYKKSIPLNHNRYEQHFEYMFVFSKGKPETFNPILQKNIPRKTSKNEGFHTQPNGKKKKISARRKEFSIIGNVWKYNVGFRNSSKDKFAYEHPAMFPEALVRDHILSWSKEGDVVLDPFAGSGTTLKMAKLMNRNYLGFEISNKYVSLINERKKQESILAHFDITQALATQESLNRNLTEFSKKENSQIPATQELR